MDDDARIAAQAEYRKWLNRWRAEAPAIGGQKG
jgi:hypothetical protein